MSASTRRGRSRRSRRSRSPSRSAASRPLITGIAASRLFAYGSVFLIQLRVLWGIGSHRDFSSGDSTQYFGMASRWSEHLELDPIWSPLYQLYWGSLSWFPLDAYEVTVLHRVLIALALSLLVLAVLRRLLTPGIAWVLAVWFAVNPVNYDTIYEVHLFSALPLLAAVLVALSWSGLAMRAGVFGILLGTTVLQRNETIVAVLAWGTAWAAYEIWRRRRGRSSSSPGQLARAVAIPVAAVALLGGAAVLSYDDRSRLREHSDLKHELNVCQIYAFGYQQRHDDFSGSPWTECGELVRRDFDAELISLSGAVAENPGAMAGHFAWNARLVPYGLQLLLFDRTAGSEGWNPDYIEITTGSALALAGTIAIAIVLAAGLSLLWRERRRWWQGWLRERAWGWVALGALGLMSVVVMISQRPRPSYLFALEVLLLALVGLAAMALIDRLPALQRLRGAPVILAPIVLLALPQHYDAGYETPNIGPDRPVKTAVERLEPHRNRLRGQEVRLVAEFSGETCAYLGGADPCSGIAVSELLALSPNRAPAWLDREGVDFIYLPEGALEGPTRARTIEALTAAGWQRLVPETSDPWLLLGREQGRGKPGTPAPQATGSEAASSE